MNRIFHAVLIVPAVLALLALAAGPSSAGVIINYNELPNEAGIEVTGSDINGNPFDVVKAGAEAFYISTPVVPNGYNPDLILSHIGISRTSPGYLVNILEADGTISDQVHIYQFIPNFTVIDFLSDPSQFVQGNPDAVVVEDGTLQNVFNYHNDRGEQVSINVQSEVDPTPEPTSLVLLGLGALGLAGYAPWRRNRTAAV